MGDDIKVMIKDAKERLDTLGKIEVLDKNLRIMEDAVNRWVRFDNVTILSYGQCDPVYTLEKYEIRVSQKLVDAIADLFSGEKIRLMEKLK